MSYYKTTMTEERARCVTKGDVVFHFEEPWLVLATDDVSRYGKDGRHFEVRLGEKGYGGHQHWCHWSEFDLIPHR